MELTRRLKRFVRSQPALMRLLQPPVLAATMALRRRRLRRFAETHGLLSAEEAGRWIAERIAAGAPTAVGKIGTLELELLVLDESGVVSAQDFGRAADRALQFRSRPSVPPELRRLALVNVGLFPPTDAVIHGFLDELRATLLEMDGLSVWGKAGEAPILERYCGNTSLRTVSGAFAPWQHVRPWSGALEGKRVLVVHPFTGTIADQYAKSREAIWRSHPAVLPEFQLLTLRMPLSAGLVAPEERDWHERLAAMKARMDGIEFDVALIGAGGMSLPLAAHARRRGRIGIHMGGWTQVLFGIKGRRFDDDEPIRRAYNESWVRPGSEETPPDHRAIEDGCYW